MNNPVWGVQVKTSGEDSIRTLKGNCQVIWYGENKTCRRRKEILDNMQTEAKCERLSIAC